MSARTTPGCTCKRGEDVAPPGHDRHCHAPLAVTSQIITASAIGHRAGVFTDDEADLLVAIAGGVDARNGGTADADAMRWLLERVAGRICRVTT